MILDKFFLKYEGGFNLTPPSPPEKTTFKKPNLIKVTDFIQNETLIQFIKITQYIQISI